MPQVWLGGRGARFLATLCALLFLTAGSAAAYTPESPEVRAMVDRAYKYLASDATHHEQGGYYLVALTFVKDGKGESHPVVAKAVQRAVAAARGGASGGRTCDRAPLFS